jgi:aminopeptidase N
LTSAIHPGRIIYIENLADLINFSEVKIILLSGLIALILSEATLAQFDVDWIDQEIQAKKMSFENRRAQLRPPVSAKLEAYDVSYYGLSLEVDTANQAISGTTVIRGRATRNDQAQISLDLDQSMAVTAVGDDATGYTHTNGALILSLQKTLNATDTFKVSITYSGCPGAGNTRGFFFRHHNSIPTIYTLSEPYYAHTWFPCKDIVGDKADSADITITVPQNLTAVSNGSLVRIVENVNGTHTFYWRERYPIAVYLISLAISNFTHWIETYTSRDGTLSMPLEYWVYPESEASARPTLAKTAAIMAHFSEIWGEYPFIREKYGQAQFSWSGGMEHQTATSLGSFNELLICHEMAHSWWGDDITCATWSDIWLNEGFARYAEALWYEHLYGSGGLTGYMNAINRPNRWNYASVYVRDTTDVGNIFNLTVYDKGAWVLHMLRGLFGDEMYFDMLAAYRQTFSGKVATTSDFQKVCEEVSAKTLDWFFDQWIYGAGLPNFEVNWQVQRHSLALWRVDVTIRQIQTTATLFRMPLEIHLSNNSNDTSFVVIDSLDFQTFSLFCDFKPDSIVIDPNNWVLKTVSYSASEPPKLPHEFHLYQPYPNPFNQSVNIQLDLPYNTNGRIVICDILGREVAVIADCLLRGGRFTGQWRPQNTASGIYFVRFSDAHHRLQRKIIYLK